MQMPPHFANPIAQRNLRRVPREITRRLACLLVCLALLSSYGAEAADPAAPAPQAEVLMTKTGIRYGIWPAKPAAPAPTVFIFAASIEETLNSAYFRQAGNHLAKDGYL